MNKLWIAFLVFSLPFLSQAQESARLEMRELLEGCYLAAAQVEVPGSMVWSDLQPCDAALAEESVLDAEQRHASLLNRAIIYTELGEFDLAGADYQAALSLQPDDARTRVNLAVMRFLQGNFQSAGEELDLALQAATGDLRAVALYNKVLVLDAMGRRSEALEVFESLRRDHGLYVLDALPAEEIRQLYPLLPLDTGLTQP